jgi:hypothetical protein
MKVSTHVGHIIGEWRAARNAYVEFAQDEDDENPPLERIKHLAEYEMKIRQVRIAAQFPRAFRQFFKSFYRLHRGASAMLAPLCTNFPCRVVMQNTFLKLTGAVTCGNF